MNQWAKVVAAAGVLALALSAGSAKSHAQNFVMFEAEDIVGEVQLPSVQIFITRQNLNKDYELELDESFIQDIVDAIERKPF